MGELREETRFRAAELLPGVGRDACGVVGPPRVISLSSGCPRTRGFVGGGTSAAPGAGGISRRVRGWESKEDQRPGPANVSGRPGAHRPLSPSRMPGS